MHEYVLVESNLLDKTGAGSCRQQPFNISLFNCRLLEILPNRFSVNRYESTVVRPGFGIKPPFSFSEPQAIKPVRELLEMHWIKDLTDILSKKSSKQVILLIVEKEYMHHY